MVSENLASLFPDDRLTGATTLRQAQLVMLRILRIVDHLCRKHDIPYWLEAGTLLGAVRHQGFIPWDDDVDIAMRREDFERFAAIAPRELPDDLFFQTAATDAQYRYVLPKVRDRKSVLVEDRENVPYCQGIFVDVFPFDSYPNRAMMDVLTLRHRLRMYRKRFPPGSAGRAAYVAGLYTAGLPLILALYAAEWSIRRFRDTFCNKPGQELLSRGVEFYTKPMHSIADVFPLTEVSFEGYKFLAPRKYHDYLQEKFGDYMKPPPEGQREGRHASRIVVDITQGA
ncbi:MAG TPA: LicD family protein [Negativicutes bacterium]|nr:LicD family protein [Negativicutes bacterium]